MTKALELLSGPYAKVSQTAYAAGLSSLHGRKELSCFFGAMILPVVR